MEQGLKTITNGEKFEGQQNQQSSFCHFDVSWFIEIMMQFIEVRNLLM